MKNRHWTRRLFKVHSYTGLITGIAFLLIGISGSILVFSRDLDRVIYKDLLEVEPRGSRISFDSAYHFMLARFPEMDYITYDGIPQTERSSYQFFMMKDGVHFKGFLDPYNVEVLHSGKQHDYWMDWLFLFHFTFSIPIWGELAAALLSLTLLVSIVTGAIVYRKYIMKVFLFKVPFKVNNWRRMSSSFHRIVGVWSLAFHVMFAITAFWMLRHTFTANHYQDKSTAVVAPVITYSIDKVLNDIKEQYPDFQPRFITLPETDGVSSFVYGYSEGVSFFYADYYDEIEANGQTLTANFLKDRSPMQKLEQMIFPVHAGLYGNLVIKIIYCLGGLTPALLSLTGFFLWWRRKRHATPRHSGAGQHAAG